ncbi:Leucine-rich repeat (LRR) family protein [Abeliophyllum distichum]|uniref:Leucine-rich repeat (LRR) family protein n=1 Tax=Abeliophyllum distichum TaxID=126358 RepID=A0ABD1P8S4_9LAMI
MALSRHGVAPDICNTYKGFVCDILLDYGEKALAGVNFNGFNFDGPELNLNGFIEELPDIIIFHANSNSFTGAFPSKLSELKYLYELDLSNNKYSCDFPYQILCATKLTFLDLRFNTFSGLLPPQVFMLDLDVLFINNNNFMQKLPDNLGSTPALYLTLANNKFIGPIPNSIGLGQASKTLIEVLFLNNQLSGCLPCEIGLLGKTRVFDVSRNFLTGPIPQSFACLFKMEILNLASNQFYGPVPELVCGLPNLGNLSLSNNYFTEIGPECWKLIEKRVLDVSMNCIPGLPMQRSPAQCHAFLSRPKCCPDQSSYTWMPCKGFNRNSLEPSEFEPKSIAPVEPPLSYTALKPH